IETVLSEPDLVICDCEGAETEYLNKERFPDLARANIIVECHDWNGEQPSTIINKRFEDTHMIWTVREAGRDPNRYPFMHLWHSTARWMAVSEGRPWMMRWLLLRPKT
ncbi:MAG TPA: hypothetical protein VFK30_14075, partial [Anaerolineae bacterium]|nr:hypothetical protein [Anaerolineae bacterium]